MPLILLSLLFKLFIFVHAIVVVMLTLISLIAAIIQVMLKTRIQAWNEAVGNNNNNKPMIRENGSLLYNKSFHTHNNNNKTTISTTPIPSPPLQRSVSLPTHFDKTQPITKSELLQWRELLHEQGPVGWTWAGVDQTLQHMPWYFWAVYRLFMVRLPKMIIRSIYCRLTTGTWIPDEVTDDVIYDMIISTPLIIVCKHDSITHTLTLRVPDNLPAEFFNGISPRGLHLILCCKTRLVISAEVFGIPIKATFEQLKCGVMFFFLLSHSAFLFSPT
jgi:hypothetical protein